MTKATTDRRREQRLARALRENLKRRKAQARGRSAPPAARGGGQSEAPEDKKDS